MGDGQDGARLELTGNHLLDQSVVLGVDVGGGLVDQDDFALLEEGSTDAQQLALTH